jgi:hypothetical protein
MRNDHGPAFIPCRMKSGGHVIPYNSYFHTKTIMHGSLSALGQR